MRKAFTVVIYDKEYDVYDIEGKEHEGWNGVPKTRWLYFSERLPDGLLPPIDSPHFVPFDIGINRMVWDVKFKQKNTTKEKWNSTHFSNHTSVEMWCNNKLVYAFTTTGTDSGLSFAMAKVQYLKTMMCEHSYNFFEPEKENGRKICWYGLPATVRVKSNTWEIDIMPDYTAGLTETEWWNELAKREKNISKLEYETDKQDIEMEQEEAEECRRNGFINWGDALSDGHIYWFRK
jgi:hypothetical protein